MRILSKASTASCLNHRNREKTGFHSVKTLNLDYDSQDQRSSSMITGLRGCTQTHFSEKHTEEDISASTLI